MFGKLLKALFGTGSPSTNTTRKGGYGHGHHKKAISDGLRRGSPSSAKVMADWRWKKR